MLGHLRLLKVLCLAYLLWNNHVSLKLCLVLKKHISKINKWCLPNNLYILRYSENNFPPNLRSLVSAINFFFLHFSLSWASYRFIRIIALFQLYFSYFSIVPFGWKGLPLKNRKNWNQFRRMAPKAREFT